VDTISVFYNLETVKQILKMIYLVYLCFRCIANTFVCSFCRLCKNGLKKVVAIYSEKPFYFVSGVVGILRRLKNLDQCVSKSVLDSLFG